MLVAVQVCQQEDQRGQNNGHPDGARDVESAQKRDQTQQVAEENKEEHRQQKRHESICLVTNGWLGDLIPDENDQWLQCIRHSLWCLARVLLVRGRNAQEHPNHDGQNQQHPKNRFGDGEVERIQVLTGFAYRNSACSYQCSVRQLLIFSMKRIRKA